MKKPTKSIITSTLLALAFGAMSVGTTFALFTSEASTTINVGAAEVKLGQTLAIQSVSELGDVAVTADSSGVYTNSIGGKTYVDAQNPLLVHFEKWAPGDKAVIKITNNNLSNVTIKTRFRVDHTSTSTPDLFNALTLDYLATDANNANIGYKFMEWSPVEPTVSKISDVKVTVTFPDHDNGEILFGDANHDNQYQNCNCSIMFTQEAVQGNAQTNSILDQMNAALDAAATTAGRNKTMYDALQDVSALISEPLIKTAGYVWNVNTDHFYYGQENVTNEFFKIYDAMPETQTNSIYASSTWMAPTVNLTGVGFDAGNASTISAVNYVGIVNTARTNTIRTNSLMTSVSVDAPLDTISHYGDAGSLTLNAIAGNSYHENGKIAFAEVKNGRMALEKGAEVAQIHLAVTGSGEDAHFNNIVIAKAENVDMPKVSRDPVTIPDEGRLVVALQEGTEAVTEQTQLDYVWLTAVGVYEQVVVSDQKEDLAVEGAKNSYAADLDQNEQAKKNTAQQIANNISATVGGNDYTLTASTNDGGQTWTYALESETPAVDPITENVSVAVQTVEQEKVVTVSVAGQAKETKAENGMTAEEKAAAEEAVVEDAISEEVAEEGQAEQKDYVARIGLVGYESFAAALESVKDGQTIVLLDNAEFGSQITISNNIGIDLFGHTLNFLPLGTNSYWGPTVTAFRIQEEGTLRLKDSASTKGQFVINPPYTCSLTFANNYGTLNIDGLTILLDIENYQQSVDTTRWNTTNATNRGSVDGIRNYGTLNISNAIINNASNGGTTSITNYGTLSMQRSILNLTGNSASTYGINANASNNVASINNISNSTINISEQGQGLTFTKSIATVSNCTINMSGTQSMSASSAYGIYVGKSAIAVGEPEVLITGNTVVRANYSSYGATCISVNAGHVVIEEGVVVDGGSDGYALRFGASALSGFENAAQLEVKGGTYSGEVNSTSKTGTMVISGGTFNGDICLNNGSSTQSTVVISGGTFNGDITASGNYLYTIEDNENVHINYGAQIGDVKYMTLNAAINAANDNETIVVLKDSYAPVFASNGKTFTVDLNGHTISINNNDAFNVYNNTNVTLIDTSEGEKGSIVTTCDGCSAIWIGSVSTDNSSLTINNGITLTGTAHAICLNAGAVMVTINSATLNGDISQAEGTTLIDNR